MSDRGNEVHLAVGESWSDNGTAELASCASRQGCWQQLISYNEKIVAIGGVDQILILILI